MSKELWMIYDVKGLARNHSFVKMFEERGLPYDIQVKAVLDTEYESRLRQGEKPSAVLVRTICPTINDAFEKRKIPVWNSSFVSKICNHKGTTREYLKDTIFCTPTITCSYKKIKEIMNWDMESLRHYMLQTITLSSSFQKKEEDRIEEAKDYVIKTANGNGGNEVFSFLREKEKIKEAIKPVDYVIQPMLPVGKESRDMRIYILNEKVYAAVLRHSSKDFRANFSLGGKVEPVNCQDEIKEIIQKILEKISFGMAGIDFILEEDGTPVLSEIEDVAGTRMLYQCRPDLDIVKDYMKEIDKSLFEE